MNGVAHQLFPGDKFGSWVVVERGGLDSGRNRMWTCKCPCGASNSIRATVLVCGRSLKCHECSISSHGMTHSLEYQAWDGMISRCADRRPKVAKHYFDRGIRVCPEWDCAGGFTAFFAHVGPKPSPEHTLDRIDNDRGYEPGNVRWATWREQMNNTSKNRHVTAFGETKTMRQWADSSGLSYVTIAARLNRGWSAEDAVSKPPRWSRKNVTHCACPPDAWGGGSPELRR